MSTYRELTGACITLLGLACIDAVQGIEAIKERKLLQRNLSKQSFFAGANVTPRLVATKKNHWFFFSDVVTAQLAVFGVLFYWLTC